MEYYVLTVRETFAFLFSAASATGERVLVASLLLWAGVIFGWAFGVAAGGVAEALRLDRYLIRAGFHRFLARAGIRLSSSVFFGALARWFIFAGFFIAACRVAGLEFLGSYLIDLSVLWVPQILVLSATVVITAFAASFVKEWVVRCLKGFGSPDSAFAGSFARGLVWVAGLYAIVSRLSLTEEYARILFVGCVAALALAFSLAFGLGGKEEAFSFLVRMRKKFTERV